MVMRAKKKFVVVAYDIANDKRRSYVVKILEKVGTRVNNSVFECILTDAQFEKLKKAIWSKIDEREDQVVYYSICVDCYTKIIYQPIFKKTYEKVFFI